MKKYLGIIGLFLLTFTSFSQTVCDSLVFVSLEKSISEDSTYEVRVYNESSELFSYPQFIILSEEGDTLGVETINYFGIGWQPGQVHKVKMIDDVNVLIEGQLHLIAGVNFPNETVCTYPIQQNQILSIDKENLFLVAIYPNPSKEYLNVRLEGVFSGEVRLFNDQGVEVMKKTIFSESNIKFEWDDYFEKGVYILKLENTQGAKLESKFVIE